MANSEATTRAESVLQQVLEALQPEVLREAIDEPLESAAKAFRFSEPEKFSNESFTRTLAGFVQHLYAQGLRLSRQLTEDQAGAEAMSLLDNALRDQGGYESAVADAIEGADIDEPLLTIKEAIRTRERQNYTRHVIATQLDYLNWPTRCALTKCLLEHYRPYLPSSLRNKNTEQLAHLCVDLLLHHLETRDPLRALTQS